MAEPRNLTSDAPPPSIVRRARRRRLWAVPLSLALHGLALLVLILTYRGREPPVDDGPVTTASLVEGVQLADSTPSPGPPQPKPQAVSHAVEQKSRVRPTRNPPPEDDETLEADEEPAPVLTDAQIASAATAESGGGGGGGSGAGGGGGRECNMTRLLQEALRRDRSVQAAVAEQHRASGRAMLVWNGDWVRHTGQDGKGMAIVREAIAWEVGFAPAACRSQPVHGLVMIALTESPGGPRLVLGQNQWRWSDVLGLQPR